MKSAVTRIGVFYDGNFFHVVSTYYAHHHARRARISLSGLHEFVRGRVAEEEQVDARWCQIVAAHYFRGRFSASQAEEAGKLFSERQFDDVLIREGVTTHYLPMGNFGTEKGIDVWFALEAYEMAIHDRFDVCVLVAGDSDYVPLVRKLNGLGTRVMVIGWNLEYTDASERLRTTRTSQALLDEVTYPVLLSSLIEEQAGGAIEGLFLSPPPRSATPPASHAAPAHERPAPLRHTGRVQNLIQREADNRYFGFITADPGTPGVGGENLWFGERDLDGVAFSTLARGDLVSFEVGSNWQGPCAKHVRRG